MKTNILLNLLITVLALTTCVVIFCGGCKQSKDEQIEKQLQGVWRITLQDDDRSMEQDGDTSTEYHSATVFFLLKNGWIEVVIMDYPNSPRNAIFSESGRWDVHDNVLTLHCNPRAGRPDEIRVKMHIDSLTSTSLQLSQFDQVCCWKRDTEDLELLCHDAKLIN